MGYCRPMSAKISPRQCEINRRRERFPCQGCAGLEDVTVINLEEMVMSTATKESPPGRKGRHLLCSVPGCGKIRVKDGLCKAHYNEQRKAAALTVAAPVDKSPLSVLLPPSEPAVSGYFLNLSDFPELAVWLKEVCEENDIPLAIIGLLEARRQGLLLPKGA